MKWAARGKALPVKTLLRGVVAGLVGTAAMTGAQLLAARVRGESSGTPVPSRWSDAPAPAQVAKKGADAIGEGDRVTRSDVPRLTTAMHWSYGTALGVLYALAARVVRPSPLLGGLGYGVGVWSASYAQLVPLGIYEPPWNYPLRELALDLGYHLVYGAAAAEAFAVVDRR
jgi:uncharacterized membrane protein YagU involved in acid resistance